MKKKRILFVCVHNSGRSQIAEAWLKHLAPDQFEVESAGLLPGQLNPLVVTVMKEAGIDISGNRTKSIHQVISGEKPFDTVITLCEQGAAGCPIIPGVKETLHWNFPDPAGFTGSEQERLIQARRLRDEIKQKLEAWIEKSAKQSA
ncbi:MAG: arsenate reductase ArsC [Candidatus Omnitrophica bacterium]|nr:arsenate reductase ArsC [Candidatus Omnitrophota bacterium]